MIIKTEKTTVDVIKQVKHPIKGIEYEPLPLMKKCFRVWPVTGRDVFLIQTTAHQDERFAPAKGTGIILTQAAVDRVM